MSIGSIADTLPEPRDVLRWGLLIVGVSIFVGLLISYIFLGSPAWPDILANIRYSFIYTVIMFTSVNGTAGWLRTRVSVRSRWAVALHAGTLAVATVVSYGLATLACWLLYPAGFGLNVRIQLTVTAIAFLITLAWSAFRYMGVFYRQLRDAEAARYEARLQALRAQINPHFLFNAFNSIAALIRTRSAEAERVVEDLSALFRYALRASEDDTATLEEEIQAARRYLDIEKARFRDRLHVEIDVPDPLQTVSLPSMTLQPLVENAVKHGVGQTAGPCTVAITAEQTDDTLVLRVQDTGPGFDAPDLEAVLDEGSGLANVRERLRLFFDDAAQMQLCKKGVELRLPLDRAPAPTPSPDAQHSPLSS
jgi:signal transduction histidine kinase